MFNLLRKILNKIHEHYEVELELDCCIPPFDITEVGKLSIQEIDEGIRTMEAVHNIKKGSDKYDTKIL